MIGRDGRSLLAGDLGAAPAPQLADLGPSPQAFPSLRLPSGIGGLQFTPDGSRLLAFGKNGQVKTYDPTTGKADGPTFQLPGPGMSAKLAPDGQTIAFWQPPAATDGPFGDQVLEVWDMSDRCKTIRANCRHRPDWYSCQTAE